MEVEINGIEELVETIQALAGDEVFTQPMFEEIAMLAMFRIQARTSAGKDYENMPFAPYTPSYAKYRERKGHPTTPPNLFFSGRMLGQGMTSEATSESAKIFFADTRDPDNERVTQAEKAFYNYMHRPFFRLNAEDIDKIRTIIESYSRKARRRRR